MLEPFLGQLGAAEIADPVRGVMDDPGTGGAQSGDQPAPTIEAGLIAFVVPSPAMKGAHYVGAGDFGALRSDQRGAGEVNDDVARAGNSGLLSGRIPG